MNEKEIRKYASLMKELELTGLEITDDQNKVVRLERAGVVAPVAQSVVAPTVATPVSKNSESSENAGYISVKSPIVGVFYAAPAENAEPFVSL
ncbi:MAG: acetyl-CoA carboxylase, biotin carboxyl carrier protein, partial [Acutalibacteraceae bacterium]|nr:acetyl-CoA carboxylase, biotin carboxyl carrier protein [Acutalibacteraceae bacterium]